MSREKKKSQPMSLRIEQTIADRLSAFCEQSGQSKTTAIERAIVAYIDDYESMMKRAAKQTRNEQNPRFIAVGSLFTGVFLLRL